MNERIQELLVKSELLEAIGSNAYEEDGWEPIVKRFAELIVQECLAQVDKVDAMLEDDKEKLGASWVGLAIVKHFGIE